MVTGYALVVGKGNYMKSLGEYTTLALAQAAWDLTQPRWDSATIWCLDSEGIAHPINWTNGHWDAITAGHKG